MKIEFLESDKTNLDNKSLGVDHPDLGESLFCGQSIFLHGHDKEISNANGCLQHRLTSEERGRLVSPDFSLAPDTRFHCYHQRSVRWQHWSDYLISVIDNVICACFG